MKDKNFTFPILAEGFSISLTYHNKAPENFDCFKDINSSLIITDFRAFSLMDSKMEEKEIQTFDHISLSTKISFTPTQRFALKISISNAMTFMFSYCYRCTHFFL